MVNFRGMKEIPTEEYSPEKAGVGGSIPSLATMFSESYRHPKPSVCSILFQFQIQACRNLPHIKMDRTCVYSPRNRNEQATVHPWEVNSGRSIFPGV